MADLQQIALEHRRSENALIWRAPPHLCGLALWGRMSPSEMRLLYRTLDGERAADAPGDFLLDARHLQRLDAALYEGLAHTAHRRLPEIERRVRRHAVLCSSGLAGAALSGLYVALEAGIEWRAFTELAAALAWLGEPNPAAMAAQLDGLVTVAMAPPSSGASLAVRLRDALADDGGSMSLGDASRALGVSTRTLQRALRAVGTSFRDEAHRARLAVSQRQLLETRDKIAAIAHRLGFSSEANFIAFFRKSTGCSPAAWRRRMTDSARSLSPALAAGAAC